MGTLQVFFVHRGAGDQHFSHQCFASADRHLLIGVALAEIAEIAGERPGDPMTPDRQRH